MKAEIYSIYGLLENAYQTIDKSDFAQRLLKFLDIQKKEITISQNRSREVLDADSNSRYDKYEIIQVGKHQALLGLYFNESLTKIEGIFIKRNLFSSDPYAVFTQEKAEDWLNSLFKTVDTKIDFTKYLSIELNKEFDDKEEFEILLHNKNRFKNDYPNMKIHLKGYNFINIFLMIK